MTTETEKILQGCGEWFYQHDFRYLCGGVTGLCQICKSKLEGYQLAQKENHEQIKHLIAECQDKYDFIEKLGKEFEDYKKETAEKVEKLKERILLNWKGQNELVDFIDKIFKETK